MSPSQPNSQEIAGILSKVSLFGALKNKSQALSELSRIMMVKEYAAGKNLLTEGETGSDFFVLISGQVSVYKKTSEGESFKVAILTEASNPGLGEAGLIEEEPRSATIVCDSLCHFLVLNRDSFAKFCDQNPAWALPILKDIAIQLVARLRQSNKDILLLHRALMNEIRG